jgi:hypothetical protein
VSAVSRGQKDIAAGMAETIMRQRQNDFKEAAATFALNPSDLVRDVLQETIEALQDARETQRAVAEWEVTP